MHYQSSFYLYNPRGVAISPSTPSASNSGTRHPRQRPPANRINIRCRSTMQSIIYRFQSYEELRDKTRLAASFRTNKKKSCTRAIFTTRRLSRRTFCENFLRKVDRFPKTLPEDVDDLETRLRYVIWNIEEEVMENVQLNLLKRIRACIRMDGGHFEHLL